MKHHFCRSHLYKICLLIYLGVGNSSIFSQSSIKGRVISGVNDDVLIGASIQVEGTYAGTYTDNEGSFELFVNKTPPFKIICTYLGFKKKDITVEGDNEELTIILEQQAFQSNEIVVRAQLRDQALQDVPVSVAALDKGFIDRSAELDDPGDLVQYVPGLSGMNFSSGGSTYTIRGINTNALGLSAESKVAIFHDGAYNGRVTTAARGFFDVERIEVLKGPQSTLFGRNATSGAINIFSSSPKFYNDLSLELKGGNWGQYGMEMMANVALSDKFAFRYAGKIDRRDGTLFISNQNDREMGKEDVIANRLSFLWRPTPLLNINLKLEQHKAKGGGIAIKSTNTDFGATEDPFDRFINIDGMPFDNNDYLSSSMKINWVINSGLSLNSISSFNHNDQEFLGDFDGLPTNILQIENPSSFSNFLQELRLEGTNDKMDWLVAGSFFTESASSDNGFISEDSFMIPIFFGFTDPSFFTFCDNNPACKEFKELAEYDISSYSYAAYGNLNYRLTDKLNLTAGIRYTQDSKDFMSSMELGNGAFHSIGFFNIQGPTGEIRTEDKWSGIQPRFIIDYKASKDIMTYFSYNRGYLAGGINNLTAKPFEEETNNAYEVGLKSNFSNGKIKFNVSGYLIDYNDLQVEILRVGLTEIENAAKVSSKGIELESSFQLPGGFDFIANAAFNDAEYKDYSIPDGFDPTQSIVFDGNVPDRNPATQLSFILQHASQVSDDLLLTTRLDYGYQSKQYFDRSNDEELAQEGFGLLNGSVNLDGLFNKKLNLSLYGYNLTNQDYSVLNTRSFEGGYTIIPGLPRLIGVKLKFVNLWN